MKQWFNKLTAGLNKTSANIQTNLKKVFALNKPKQEILDEVEEALIMSDLGVECSAEIVQRLSKKSFDQEINSKIVFDCVSEHISEILAPYTRTLSVPNGSSPYTILFSGINGSGKTTSLGKIANQLQASGKKVLIAACDTFRASATEQLEIWANRAGCDIIRGDASSDPASVAYKAYLKAKSERYDVLLVDTAGRMHNKADLMAELQKINNVLKKLDDSSPNLSLLVLDATVGQATLKQVEIFKQIININGIIITKLDGTSKAGVVVPIVQKFKIPIYYVGIGEKIDDLSPFSAQEFAKALMLA
jgi:fused signal recognition particle receptor